MQVAHREAARMMPSEFEPERSGERERRVDQRLELVHQPPGALRPRIMSAAFSAIAMVVA